MRKNGEFCDVAIKVGDVIINAHKVLLVEKSKYFKNIFFSNEHATNISEIEIENLDPTAFEDVIDYIYTGKLTIDYKNVWNILDTVEVLQTWDIREACLNYLKSQLSSTNCIDTYRLATNYNLNELADLALNVQLKCYPKLVKSKKYLILSYEEFYKLISNDMLNVDMEEMVFDSVIKWIKYDMPNRKSHLPTLLPLVRLTLISKDFYVDHVLNEPLVTNNPFIKEFALENMKYFLCPDRKTKAQLGKRRMLPHIYVIGGCSEKPNSCERNDLFVDEWCPIASTIFDRKYAGVTTLNEFIFAIGGGDISTTALNTVEMYNINTNCWLKITACMSYKRWCLGAAVLHDNIYAAGGYDGSFYLNSVERFDPKCEKWTLVEPMKYKRIGNRLVEFEDCLYCFGGFDHSNDLSSMQRYDPREGKWCDVASMTNRRSSFGATVLNDKWIFAVGGFDYSGHLDTVERYDPSMNKWETLAPMLHPRRGLDVVTMNGMVYALGGSNHCILDTVEIYNPLADQWTLGTPMSTGRIGHNAVVINVQKERRIPEMVDKHETLNTSKHLNCRIG